MKIPLIDQYIMKKKVGIVCGGYSGEAEISMGSAAMLMGNIDRERFDPVKMVISTSEWYAETDAGKVPIDKGNFSFSMNGTQFTPDVCYITIHGTPGEDGKLQGYFDMIGMPYTTGPLLNSAVTFNKLFTTRLLRQMGFNTAVGVLIREAADFDQAAVLSQLELPVFVKPNEGGSSLGASVVKNIADLKPAVEKAFAVNQGVLIEEFLAGREFSCGVIQTPRGPMALQITEIATKKDFFDYAAKYEYDQTQEITPADLPETLYKLCQRTTEQIYKAFGCGGVARVDYKLRGDQFYVIEINTTPGMTEMSLVPQQAAAMGISKTQLISMVLGYFEPEFSR